MHPESSEQLPRTLELFDTAISNYKKWARAGNSLLRKADDPIVKVLVQAATDVVEENKIDLQQLLNDAALTYAEESELKNLVMSELQQRLHAARKKFIGASIQPHGASRGILDALPAENGGSNGHPAEKIS